MLQVNKMNIGEYSAWKGLNWPRREKPVFGVSDNARLKPVSSATETSKIVEISLEASLDIRLFNKRMTKALIRLRVCASWSAPLLFATLRRQVSRVEAQMIYVPTVLPAKSDIGVMFCLQGYKRFIIDISR